jgi:hypothetical protein
MTANEVRSLVERNQRRRGAPDLPVGLGLAFIAGALVSAWILGVL